MGSRTGAGGGRHTRGTRWGTKDRQPDDATRAGWLTPAGAATPPIPLLQPRAAWGVAGRSSPWTGRATGRPLPNVHPPWGHAGRGQRLPGWGMTSSPHSCTEDHPLWGHRPGPAGSLGPLCTQAVGTSKEPGDGPTSADNKPQLICQESIPAGDRQTTGSRKPLSVPPETGDAPAPGPAALPRSQEPVPVAALHGPTFVLPNPSPLSSVNYTPSSHSVIRICPHLPQPPSN